MSANRAGLPGRSQKERSSGQQQLLWVIPRPAVILCCGRVEHYAEPMIIPTAGEPAVIFWRPIPIDDFARQLLDLARQSGRGKTVIAVDGRSGAGKSTLARCLEATLASAAIVETDDLAWNEPMFEWSALARTGVLAPFRESRGVYFRPPAWGMHDRSGQIEVASTVETLILEGVGAARRSLADLVDVSVWVQSDHETAEERGIGRDIASGENGNAVESIAFWHNWTAQEIPFFENERPWARVSVIAAGSSPETPEPTASVLIAPPVFD